MESTITTSTGQKVNSKLNDLFKDQLEELYWSEKKLCKVFKKMEEAATSMELKNMFHRQDEMAHAQFLRLKDVFIKLEKEPNKAKSQGMSGIINEIEDYLDQAEEDTCTKDAALIIEAQKAKHFEIALYGALAQLAETLGYNDIKKILGQTLQEEKQSDSMLSLIATGGINQKASVEGSAH